MERKLGVRTKKMSYKMEENHTADENKGRICISHSFSHLFYRYSMSVC